MSGSAGDLRKRIVAPPLSKQAKFLLFWIEGGLFATVTVSLGNRAPWWFVALLVVASAAFCATVECWPEEERREGAAP